MRKKDLLRYPGAVEEALINLSVRPARRAGIQGHTNKTFPGTRLHGNDAVRIDRTFPSTWRGGGYLRK